jgi:hypothetical protein
VSIGEDSSPAAVPTTPARTLKGKETGMSEERVKRKRGEAKGIGAHDGAPKARPGKTGSGPEPSDIKFGYAKAPDKPYDIKLGYGAEVEKKK